VPLIVVYHFLSAFMYMEAFWQAVLYFAFLKHENLYIRNEWTLNFVSHDIFWTITSVWRPYEYFFPVSTQENRSRKAIIGFTFFPTVGTPSLALRYQIVSQTHYFSVWNVFLFVWTSKMVFVQNSFFKPFMLRLLWKWKHVFGYRLYVITYNAHYEKRTQTISTL
jgi:hypothetical protein